MNNKKYYPFERNNYFYGKLLTVRDFEDEQKYINDKRRINNILTKGAGIVSGLNVVLLDDKTISIEAGMALDYQGREIIIDESITKKLNVLEGFETIQDFDNVYLCLNYAEKKQDMVHSITRNDTQEEASYNRVAEGYHLFLTDEVNEDTLFLLNGLKTTKKVIFHEDGLKITQYTPVYVKGGESFDIKVCIEKKNLPRAIEVDYIAESEFFKTVDGSSNLRVYYHDDDIVPYKKTELHYTMLAPKSEPADTMLTIFSDTSRISLGTQQRKLDTDKKIHLCITDEEVREAVISHFFQYHFDDVLNRGAQNSIYLAKIRLIKRNLEYSITDFQWLPFRQYVLSNYMLYLLMEDAFRPTVFQEKSELTVQPISEHSGEQEKKIASGIETIGIDLRARNKVYFSDEIAHGFGSGDVYIAAAPEELADKSSFYDQNKVYFGNMNILKGTIFEAEIPQMETAIISYIERGTFRIAVKVLENVDYTSVNIRWWALQTNTIHMEDPSEMSGVTVMVYPDTVTLSPRGKFKFNAEVEGTDSKECRWSITEQNGGQIDINGVYEAPTQEGVYEIVVESVKYPNRKATAFVVVKEK